MAVTRPSLSDLRKPKKQLTKDQLKEAIIANPQIQTLMERNAKILRGIDRSITSDFAKKFLTKISYVSNSGMPSKQAAADRSNQAEGSLVNVPGGIQTGGHTTELEKLINAFTEKERVYNEVKKIMSTFDKSGVL